MAYTHSLVILSTYFPPNVVGGAEVNAELLARFAQAHGWSVTVLTGASVVLHPAPYSIRSVPALRPRPSLIYEPWWNRRTAARIQALIPYRSIVHTFDVLSRGVGAELALLRPDLRCVTTLQDISPICGSIDGLLTDGTLCHGDRLQTILRHRKLQQYGPLGRVVRFIRYATATVIPYRRQLLGRYHAVTAVSRFLVNYLGIQAVSVIPDLLMPPKEACPLKQTTAPALVAVGRLDVDKGTDLLLVALMQLPAYVLTLVGSGDRADWQQRATQLGVADRVRFVGPVPSGEVGNWYYAADVVVLASRCPEASSRTLLEAMSCGRAVVGPNFAGPAELIIEGSTGRLFERGDAVSLATTIEQAYKERVSLGRRAKEVSRRYHPDSIAPRYLALYQSLLEQVSWDA
ncbi:glycosyltransferase family 4 protein [Candidatus Berkelbacteria bacterium]|nr:glycosyltransferase family 4 protein [Candidatus Berkelbacteria bacterium]